MIRDADPSLVVNPAVPAPARSTSLPAALHLTTTTEVDGLGRTTKVTDPKGNVTYAVYDDDKLEVRTYPGWNAATKTTTGPVSVQRQDRPGSYAESLTFSWSDPAGLPVDASGVPTGAELLTSPYATIESLGRAHTNLGGQVDEVDAYFDLGGVAYSTAQTLGAEGVNFNRTSYAYDGRGRQSSIVDANGTIYSSVYDGLGRAVSEWVGTNDAGSTHDDPLGDGNGDGVADDPSNNMSLVADYQYDLGGIGDGNLTRMVQYPGGSATPRVVLMYHDWRNRPVATHAGLTLGGGVAEDVGTPSIIAWTTYDNLSQATVQWQYAGAGTDSNLNDGSLNQPAAGKLRALGAAAYDDHGRVYRQTVYSVDPSTGSVGNALNTNVWYDLRGNVIKISAPGGLVTKSSYDGVGRTAATYQTDGGGDSGWGNAGDVAGDTVLEQQEVAYDAASNIILQATRQRFHNATGTGVLGTPGTGVGARVSYMGSYYDAANRPTNAVDVGTNGGAAYAPPSTVPARSDTALVTGYAYDAAGRVRDVTDPRGLTARTEHDLSGRVTATIENLTNADSFDRPNGLLAGSQLLAGDGTWEVKSGGWAVKGGKAASTTGPNEMAVTDVGGTDGVLEVTVADVSTYKFGLVARYADASNYLYVLTGLHGGQPFSGIYRYTNGTLKYISVDYFNSNPNIDRVHSGDKLRLVTEGSSVKLYVNDVLVSQGVDPDPQVAGTKWGITSHYNATRFDDFHFTGTEADADRTTRYAYDGIGDVAAMTADLPVDQVDQTTAYNYAINGSDYSSNSVLSGVTYPDPATGLANNPAQQELFSTNRIGERTVWTDRNGTTHEYAHDALGRLGSDRVITFGAGVDQAVDRLTYAFDDAGRPLTLTSRNTQGGSVMGDANIVNRVQREYNGFGQLVKEYQAHDGNVDTTPATGTPFVGYGYSEGASGVNHSRRTSMTYPNGRVLDYTYGYSGLNARISRLDSLHESYGSYSGGTTLEHYDYLGLGTVVTRTVGPIKLNYVGPTPASAGSTGGGDQYGGLDRFGRVVDQHWSVGYSGSTIDRLQYGYDRDGNRLFEKNALTTGMDELYHDGTGYDGLNRLTAFSRGTLNFSNTAITGTAGRSQAWDLDALGNMNAVATDGAAEARTHDAQNRLTGVGASPLAYSANGEMTADEAGNGLFYDAWGRLAGGDWQVPGYGGVAVGYKYDALNRRIARSDDNGIEPPTDFYHSDQWQVLEERNAAGATTTQYVWSPVYVDAMILRDRDANGDGDTTDQSDQRLYFLQDANYNVTAVAGRYGAVLERFAYDPYGRRTTLSASWQAGADAYGVLHGHQGGRVDPATGLVHFRMREYDPELMRWTRQDPAGYVDGLMVYTAFSESPINYVDPQGQLAHLWPVVLVGAKIGTVLATVGGAAILCYAVNTCGTCTQEYDKWLQDRISALPTSQEKDNFYAKYNTPLERMKACGDACGKAIGEMVKASQKFRPSITG